MVRKAGKYIVQQLAQRGGPKFKKYITQEYGQIAGSAAGIAISYLAGGDYFGEIRKSLYGDDSPYDRAPPIGYYRGDEVNGQTYGKFNKTLRSIQFAKRARKCNNRFGYRYICKCAKRKSKRGSTRRFRY